MPIEYGAHTACYSVSSGNKGPGIKTDKNVKEERYIPQFPLRFVQGGFYLHLLLVKRWRIWWYVGTLKIEICVS